MRPLFAAAVLALASVTLPAQVRYNVSFPSGIVRGGFVYGGKPCLLLVQPGGDALAEFLEPGPGLIPIRLRIEAWGVYDPRPCYAGTRLGYGPDDYNSMHRVHGWCDNPCGDPYVQPALALFVFSIEYDL